MTITVAVAGASGYAGGEILRLLLNHPRYASGELEIGTLTGASTAGESLGKLMPHLPELADRVVQPTTPENLAGHDVVFLALPHGHSAKIAKECEDSCVIIDCAADFRLHNQSDWDHYYGGNYAGSWTYGIPEMPGHREHIRGARKVAVPGCFPTGATLALWPAIKMGLVKPDISIVSVTGVSGGGKKPAVGLLGAETMGSLSAYNVAGSHRHTPEIVQNLSEYSSSPVSVSFTPILAPLPRGILTTAIAPIAPGVSHSDVYNAYVSSYESEPFVQVLPPGIQPQTQSVVGSNMCHIQVAVDSAAEKLIVTSAIDNLTKGTGGAAVQCMNIILGWDEASGLPRTGTAP
ncbi:N-acetyl-gamma-glutamyl-phosphate reductase [Corynebacterium ulcerans]|uniref:N-acetyl-gamma-glutamyl-phosphate reductase n=1 Tax=Corynebacterium ulcerans TaxID=65058 RepID=UPI0002141A72|nr:N-acetyl-gamma-glutamyl-phosphate reductase [Corynebacterium ulcerans]AEG83732.1 N-acetyl-gamma-glutamyl-phosphate reductase [Corynebacterium ulcerans BR-AD22]NOL59181.1 N-acetyl-gamma-glutamyl-phosphate reductase [Corynebacterium ulcerans]NOM03434.1 N-acetyl-gamma-glutamyl-phosphate reductase [Corynebacterium ulcerans]